MSAELASTVTTPGSVKINKEKMLLARGIGQRGRCSWRRGKAQFTEVFSISGCFSLPSRLQSHPACTRDQEDGPILAQAGRVMVPGDTQVGTGWAAMYLQPKGSTKQTQPGLPTKYRGKEKNLHF